MKKTASLLMCALLILSTALIFTGCNSGKIRVESLLKIDNSFSGSREISFIFPKGAELGILERTVKENLPQSDDNCYTVETASTADYGMKFTFRAKFSSQQDYIAKMSALVGRDVAVYMAQPDSILTKGTRMTEDFDVRDITLWFTNTVKNNKETKALGYEYVSNLVNINGAIFSTDTTINVKDVTGYEINSVTVETTNNKNNLYERRFIFSIPEKTYKSLSNQLTDYFAQRTDDVASYSDWVQKGSNYEYEVIYQNISLEEMNLLTNKMLDVSDCVIEYGDKTNSSTPLSEGLVFEEKLDLFAFMGKDKGNVPVYYRYSLPTTTTHGDGVVLDKGVWQAQGKWTDGTYSLDADKSVVSIHIPDGIQYSIEGIDFSLENTGKNSFTHTTSFLYSKATGKDGCDYASKFFKGKNAETQVSSDGKFLECKVTLKGGFSEISSELIRLFGGGNYIEYNENDHFANIANKPKATEYINIGYMLTTENAKKPITYTAFSNGGDSILSISTKGDGINNSSNKPDENNKFAVKISGNSSVSILYTAPNGSGIALYCIIGGVMIFLTVFAILILIKAKNKNNETHNNAPTQTTAFSINELLGRSKGNKSNSEE